MGSGKALAERVLPLPDNRQISMLAEWVTLFCPWLGEQFIRRVGHGVGQAGFHRFSRSAFPKMVYTFIGKILLGWCLKNTTFLQNQKSENSCKNAWYSENIRRFGGGRWIRTTEVIDSRFTVCPLWPLGNSPIFRMLCCGKMELVDGFEPPTCWLQISCSTNWAIPATRTARLIIAEEGQNVNTYFSLFSEKMKKHFSRLYPCRFSRLAV